MDGTNAMSSFSSVIATVAAPPNGAITLSASRRTVTPSPFRPAHRIGVGAEAPSRIAYLVINDEELAEDLRAAIEHSGIQARLFRSTEEYLACRRSEVASCLLISRQLSDKSGLDLPTMLAPASSPPIIVLSDQRDIPACVRAIKEGAHDFLTLPIVTPRLLEAIEAAFKKDAAALVLRERSRDLRNRWQSLTSREAEVMRYAVGGFLNKQTAAELRIAENTVQVHRGRVMRKMHAESFAALVRMSLQLLECGERILLHNSSEQACELPVTQSSRLARNDLSMTRNAYA